MKAAIEFEDKEKWKYMFICDLHDINYQMTYYPACWYFEIDEPNLSKLLEVTKEFKYFPVDRYKLQMAGHNIFGWKKPEDEEMF